VDCTNRNGMERSKLLTSMHYNTLDSDTEPSERLLDENGCASDFNAISSLDDPDRKSSARPTGRG
jgi:hypothetical protein